MCTEKSRVPWLYKTCTNPSTESAPCLPGNRSESTVFSSTSSHYRRQVRQENSKMDQNSRQSSKNKMKHQGNLWDSTYKQATFWEDDNMSLHTLCTLECQLPRLYSSKHINRTSFHVIKGLIIYSTNAKESWLPRHPKSQSLPETQSCISGSVPVAQSRVMGRLKSCHVRISDIS